jgi:outer membrane receptor protein involved in Fe transport
VINAFDKVYELRDGSGIGVGAPQYGPRRALFVSASKTF